MTKDHTDIVVIVKRIVASVIADNGNDVKINSISENDSLGDLGFDDLDICHILFELEEIIGVTVDDDCITVKSTIGDIARAIVSSNKLP